MPPYCRFIGILAAMAALRAHGQIPSDPTQVHPLPVGAQAPIFEGVSADGKVRSFTPRPIRHPTIVIF